MTGDEKLCESDLILFPLLFNLFGNGGGGLLNDNDSFDFFRLGVGVFFSDNDGVLFTSGRLVLLLSTISLLNGLQLEGCRCRLVIK